MHKRTGSYNRRADVPEDEVTAKSKRSSLKTEKSGRVFKKLPLFLCMDKFMKEEYLYS